MNLMKHCYTVKARHFGITQSSCPKVSLFSRWPVNISIRVLGLCFANKFFGRQYLEHYY